MIKPENAVDSLTPITPTKKIKGLRLLSWISLFIIIIFTALGVSGSNLFSPVSNSDKTGTIEYEHLLRCQTEAKLKIRLHKFKGPVQLVFPENYLQYFKIKLIYPAPQDQYYSNGNIVYTFNADEENLVNFYLEPRKTGRIKGSLMVGKRSYTLSNFIYPK